MVFFEAYLAPQAIIIEANNEEDLKLKLKGISIVNLVFDHKQVPKEEVIRELKKRYIFIDLGQEHR